MATLAAALFVAISLTSSPSVPSTPAPYEIPTQDDATKTADLVRWMVSGRSASPGFHAIRSEDFDAILAPGSRNLGLFPPETASESQRRVLLDVPFGNAISVAAERHDVDGFLLAAIVSVESRFSPRAVSPRGARGLMQIRPVVARAYGVSDPFDPYANVDAGSRYLKSLLADYDGNLELTLAAYNAGPAAVARYGGVPPYRETQAYVRKVLSRYEKYNQAAGARSL